MASDCTLTVPLLSQTYAWGNAFEQWVILEIVKNASYYFLDRSFSYARTKEDMEIDLIVERPGSSRLLIETEPRDRVQEGDAKGLETFGADLDPKAKRWLLSNDTLE